MAESVINGTDLYCFIEGVSIAHATSHTLSIKTAVIPTSNKDTGLYATKIPGRSDVTVTCEGFIAYGDFETVVNAKIARLPVTLSLGKKLAGVLDTSQTYFTGEFIITSYEMSAGDNSIATYNVNFDHYSNFGTMSAGEIAIRAGNTFGWYDYTDVTTLTDDGGGLISSWRDKLLSGNDLAAATTARPTLDANGILFNGTSNFMRTAILTLVQPTFIYMVLKEITWTDADYITDGRSGSLTGVLYQNTLTPRLSMYAGSNACDNIDLAVGDWGIIRSLFNGVSSKLIINNGTPVTGNPGSASMGGFTIGSIASGGSSWANIQVKEIIVRNIMDSIIDEAAIYNYLKTKYSL